MPGFQSYICNQNNGKKLLTQLLQTLLVYFRYTLIFNIIIRCKCLRRNDVKAQQKMVQIILIIGENVYRRELFNC